uniref:Uncharacterized protein n=1 Tax=Globisporangium ultimum (strain ATCC 200006 / CBS 805.95 / DAOM BR144) TaxID=431595 RepID=K3WL96_GLOUD
MALYLCVFHSLANIPLDDPLARAVSSRFSMQPNMIVAIWLGMGLIAILKWPTARFRGFPAVVFRHGVCMSLVLYQLHTGFDELRARWYHDDTLRSYAQGILHSLPQNAVLLSYTDINWNTIRYLQLCERQRGDVTHLSLQLMPFPWFPRQHHLLRERNIHFPAISAD